MPRPSGSKAAELIEARPRLRYPWGRRAGSSVVPRGLESGEQAERHSARGKSESLREERSRIRPRGARTCGVCPELWAVDVFPGWDKCGDVARFESLIQEIGAVFLEEPMRRPMIPVRSSMRGRDRERQSIFPLPWPVRDHQGGTCGERQAFLPSGDPVRYRRASGGGRHGVPASPS